MDVFKTLSDRGFIEQTTHDKELKEYLAEGQATCYIGFDPTASSLHVGSLVPIMALVHMQKNGHRPIALVGGGTGLIGDPSGKTEMRKMLTLDDIEANAVGLKKQLSRFLDFTNDSAMLLNNADWLVPLTYIPFLRDIGRHFSVNRMVKTESCRLRMESDEGLSFIEFNYMVLQAYDFLELYQAHNCRIQMGGSDQWGNIVAGIDLIRRKKRDTAFGITFPLITTAGGGKMGKTAKGAVWLDPERTSPYQYYQFWRDTDDRDVVRFLSLFTLLPLEEIRAVGDLSANALNSAKIVLAYEATRLAHGHRAAEDALGASASTFGAEPIPNEILPSSGINRHPATIADNDLPKTIYDAGTLKNGIPAFKLFADVGLAKSKGDARRLISQGGGYLNGQRLAAFDTLVTADDIQDGHILLRAGKTRYHRIVLK